MFRLRTRMLAAYVLVLAPTLVVAAVVAYGSVRSSLENELGVRLATVAQAIAAEYNASPEAGRIERLTADSARSIERLEGELEVVRAATELRRIRVLDRQLRMLVDTGDAETFATAFDLERDRTELDRVFADADAAWSVLFWADDGTPYMLGYAPVIVDERVVAVVAAEGSAAYFGLLRNFRRGLAATTFAALALTALVTLALSRRITAPLTRLSDASRRLGRGELDVPIDTSGNDEIAALANTLDVTRRALKAREEETQMMLAGIAHEVRNPIGGMELFVGVLEEELADDPERAQYAARVRRELAYLTRVVHEFLAFARERTLQPQRFCARALLDEVRASSEAVAGERGVRLTLAVPEGAELVGDREALRGVLQNLVHNAVQASGAGDEVSVELESAHGSSQLHVLDRGVGMSAETRDNVFRPFFTTREKGTGLGLPLARKVVERHGGSIVLHSEPGHGTVVTVTLPFDASVPWREADAPSQTAEPGDDEGMEMIG